MNNLIKTLKDSMSLKPKDLIISDVKWKYLIRSTFRGKNILMIGPTGCGKTKVAQSVAKALNKPFFKFNMGSTQDARSSLIGNTNFDKETGTVFNESMFIRAIKTPGAVILLDEVSRAHHDAWNILMTVLDPIQRYVRLDEKRDNEIVSVADGVSFIGTANIGNEYTATRVMDRALMNRFPVKIEMDFMTKDEELNFMVTKYNVDTKNTSHYKTINAICEIAAHTRAQSKLDDGKLTNFITTRSVEEMAELITDGFSLSEIAESAIYPEFAGDGGLDSERTYVKQLVQKYVVEDTNEPLINDRVGKSTQPPY